MQQGEDVELLKSLGLSSLQAKVYLALDKLGSSTAREAYKFTDVARQDIYRILMELQQLGLVEKILASPTKFASLPLVDGVYLLLEAKTREDTTLRTRVKELIEKNKDINKTFLSSDAADFSLFHEKALTLKIEKALMETKATLDVIMSKERFSFWLFNEVDLINGLFKKGVRVRFIVDKISSEIEITEALIRNNQSNLSGRYTLKSSPVHLALFDNKLLFCNTLGNSIGQTSILCSNSDCLIMLAQNYFNEAWKKSILMNQKKVQEHYA